MEDILTQSWDEIIKRNDVLKLRDSSYVNCKHPETINVFKITWFHFDNILSVSKVDTEFVDKNTIADLSKFIYILVNYDSNADSYYGLFKINYNLNSDLLNLEIIRYKDNWLNNTKVIRG